ncbi:hypothetical protein BDW22DRAFT_1433547 [Trametopsis cervina]|nr:hypothetical protein BDW22DRAFT_1433547 [Trametopsis cervina]
MSVELDPPSPISTTQWSEHASVPSTGPLTVTSHTRPRNLWPGGILPLRGEHRAVTTTRDPSAARIMRPSGPRSPRPCLSSQANTTRAPTPSVNVVVEFCICHRTWDNYRHLTPGAVFTLDHAPSTLSAPSSTYRVIVPIAYIDMALAVWAEPLYDGALPLLATLFLPPDELETDDMIIQLANIARHSAASAQQLRRNNAPSPAAAT